jgi:hypothetical protein
MIRKLLILSFIILIAIGCKKEEKTTNPTVNQSNSSNTQKLPQADFSFDGKSYSIKTSSFYSGTNSVDIPTCFVENYNNSFTLVDSKNNISFKIDLPKKAGVYNLNNIECDGGISFQTNKIFSNHVVFRGDLSNGTLQYDGNGNCKFEAKLYDSSEDLEINPVPHSIKGNVYIPIELLTLPLPNN